MEKKKILMITGSPKPEGNTNTLSKAFMYGALIAKHEVEVFDAVHCNMQGCHGDKSCFERGCCGIQDDGVQLNKLMRWADILVIASPVFWGGFTSQIKRVLDRFYQFTAPKGRKTCTVKETFLIAACATPDKKAFDIIRQEYQRINEVLDFKSIGELLVPGLEEENVLDQKSEEVEKAIIAGYSLGQMQEGTGEDKKVNKKKDKNQEAGLMRQHREGCWYV